MNAKDSKAITDKVNELLDAAEEFGSQSKQLSEARGDFDQYLAAVKGNTKELAKLIAKCEEYISSANAIVEKDLSEQVSVIVKQTEQSVASCKAHCEEVTKEYNEILTSFEEQKKRAEEKNSNLISEISKDIEQVYSTTRQILEVESKNAIGVVNSLTTVNEEIIKVVKSEVDAIKELQKKDHKIIMLGSISAVIAAIVAIIGLFL